MNRLLAARLVLVPHESHGYTMRESLLHKLAEMFAWADGVPGFAG
jgi:dipeptidyl aminopeptidase/acylaminoacyl peptidase